MFLFTRKICEIYSNLTDYVALDIELDTGAQKAAIFAEIVCPGPCKG